MCLCAQELKVASKNGVLQEFELLAVVSQAVWVLGTELGAFGKAGSTVLSTTEPSLYLSYSHYCSCQTAYFSHPPANILTLSHNKCDEPCFSLDVMLHSLEISSVKQVKWSLS